eukprot:CAMPEP_0202916122 /NCGR_PEP_ID=MMETSP1392-20130828/67681_1 /ASSEMBLY_ACC=CAM_ASM_000868 /TAXON_ID=225041 /ORGANISM="Chlamydomonas chlamydogama, Strain SAG 11-48b" /LENGTH=116 /DNA_ID=CAMNT_0049608423 /DNA_START=254 /DNA_END=604 /DNA_ORIENTATION=-
MHKVGNHPPLAFDRHLAPALPHQPCHLGCSIVAVIFETENPLLPLAVKQSAMDVSSILINTKGLGYVAGCVRQRVDAILIGQTPAADSVVGASQQLRLRLGKHVRIAADVDQACLA